MSITSKPQSHLSGNSGADVPEPLQHPISSHPSPYGLFGKFPREIREPIYQLVFTAGETALTRTSKEMHEDTKQALTRYGTYTLIIGFTRILDPSAIPYAYGDTMRTYVSSQYSRQHQTYHISHPRPGAFLTNVRSLELRVVLDKPSPNRSLRYPRISSGMLNLILWDVVRRMTQPTHCRISLQLRRYPKVLPESFAALKQLRCFQRVDVELCHAPWDTRNLLWREQLSWYRRNARVAGEAVRSHLTPKRAGMTAPIVRVVRRNLFGGA